MEVELLDRCCKRRAFNIPEGWEQVVDGVAQRGDRWWRWGDESWQPIDEHAFLGSGTRLLQCVIRRAVITLVDPK